MAAKKAQPTATLEVVSVDALVEYIVETTMGHVTIEAARVAGKTDEELDALLSTDDYLSRIGAHRIVKVTRETLYKRTI